MENKIYNVLWIDDEWRKQDTFISEAKIFNIAIVPFDLVPAGLEELENNLSKYDAVILDAKVKQKDEDMANLSGLQMAYAKIHELKRIREIPYFISTGQPDLQSADYFKQIYQKAYSKGTDDEQLFEDIISKVDEMSTPEFHIRNKYQKEFQAASLVPNAENLLMQGLLFEFTDGTNIDTYFNPLRMICENIISRCVEQKYIPHLSSLNSVCAFLEQKDVEGFKLNSLIMPLPLVHSFKYLLDITQDGSHDRKDLTLGVMDYIRSRKNTHLYKSLLFIVMDILLWYKELNDSITDTEGLWSGTYEARGRVCIKMHGSTQVYIVNGNYQLQDNGNLSDGAEVIIIKSDDNKHPFDSVNRYVYKNRYIIVTSNV